MNPTTPNSPTTTVESWSTMGSWESAVVSDGKYVTLNYTLRDGSANGQILETTVYNIAQANGMTGSADSYSPFSVMIGWKQVIPGFENGLLGLKKGDRKVIEVPPELGYGTGPVLTSVPKFQIAPQFTITQDKSIFADSIKEVVPRTDLPEDMKNATVGMVFTGANNATAKVVAADTTSITLDIQNTNNPFFGKKIAVGETSESSQGDATFKITAIKGTWVTLEIVNKNSPFYNKKFEVGATTDTPTGKIEIKEIKDEEIVVAQYHPMMGKTLFFDIEIVDVK